MPVTNVNRPSEDDYILDVPIAMDHTSAASEEIKGEDTSNGQVCEVTPEMIEAGANVLARFECLSGFFSEAELAAMVYTAMVGSRCRPILVESDAPVRTF